MFMCEFCGLSMSTKFVDCPAGKGAPAHEVCDDCYPQVLSRITCPIDGD